MTIIRKNGTDFPKSRQTAVRYCFGLLKLKDSKGHFIVDIVHMTSFFLRFKGLMFKKNLPKDIGYLFTRASLIHTFFMRFAIDVVYLKQISPTHFKVVKTLRNIKPWRVSGALAADSLIELKSPAALLEMVNLQEVLIIE